MDVLSIRGTFIDCSPKSCDNDGHSVRSTSAPPAHARNTSDKHVSIADQYISSLMERTEQFGLAHKKSQPSPTNRTAPTQDPEQDARTAAATTRMQPGKKAPKATKGAAAHKLPMIHIEDRHTEWLWHSCEDPLSYSSQDFGFARKDLSCPGWSEDLKGYESSRPSLASTHDPWDDDRISSSTISDELPWPYAWQEGVIAKGDTTIMFCELPGKLQVGMLIDFVDKNGFAETYDLVYMPPRKGCQAKKRTRGNIGFCFVNFTSAEYATSFANKFHELTFPGFDRKICIRAATRQGYEANVEIHSKKCLPGTLFTFRDV